MSVDLKVTVENVTVDVQVGTQVLQRALKSISLVTLRRLYDEISKSSYHLKCPHASALTTGHIHVKDFNTSEVTRGKGNSDDE